MVDGSSAAPAGRSPAPFRCGGCPPHGREGGWGRDPSAWSPTGRERLSPTRGHWLEMPLGCAGKSSPTPRTRQPRARVNVGLDRGARCRCPPGWDGFPTGGGDGGRLLPPRVGAGPTALSPALGEAGPPP